MDQKKINRDFLGIWIPKEIYLNTELSWTDKILLIEIESLDNEKGCFASNDYFAEFLNVTKTTISTSISKLKTMGFVEQVSFDGRTRILKAVHKKIKKQTLNKSKGRIKENLKHNNTINKTNNNLKKNIDIKKVEDLDPKDLKKINEIKSGSVCIEVDQLANETMWIEHCARYLQLSMYFAEDLLKKFIAEQKLKEDNFKSIRDTKAHFLNWAKIEVAKNRKFGNDQWGRYTPQHIKTPKQRKSEEYVKPEMSEKEKKELHERFITANLIKPYNDFCETNKLVINNFGNLVFKELEKFDLLTKDIKKVNEIRLKIAELEDKKKHGKGRLRRAFEQSSMKIDLNTEIIKISLRECKEKKLKLDEIIL